MKTQYVSSYPDAHTSSSSACTLALLDCFIPGAHFRRRRGQAPAFHHLSAMAAGLALVLGGSLPSNAQPKAPEVTVANPVLKNIVQWNEYTGQFEALRRVEVRARVSGELVKLHFTDGQTVNAGDILFTIDPRPLSCGRIGACRCRSRKGANRCYRQRS